MAPEEDDADAAEEQSDAQSEEAEVKPPSEPVSRKRKPRKE
jgi:hypothetical protein